MKVISNTLASVSKFPSIPEEHEDGELPFGILPIPYSCVILLCSHKRRDNRCHVAAPILEHEFIHALQQRNWTVDTNLDHDHLHDVLPPSKPPVENASPANSEQEGTEEGGSSDGAPESKEPAPFPGNISPQMLWGLKRVLILKNSHIGGHKYAGNVIICTPAGQSVWYGRVTPHEVDTVVEQTIIQGKIIPSLLRAGMNVSRPGCLSLHDW